MRITRKQVSWGKPGQCVIIVGGVNIDCDMSKYETSTSSDMQSLPNLQIISI